MSIQLLTAGLVKIQHSEKHNLESFFWVLLYICTMFEGPGQRHVNGQRADPQHPFGHWLGKMDNLEEVGENVTVYGIGIFRNTVLGPGGLKDLLQLFVHPHFKPLIPMLEALCDEVFLLVKHNPNDETQMRMPTVASGEYDNILDILKTTLKGLPAHDSPLPPPPFRGAHRDATLMPPPLGLFKTTSAGSRRRGESMNWGSDSGYGGGETSQSSSHQGRGMVSSTGDMDGVKKRHNNSSPNKTTTTRHTTSLSTKGVTCSKHSNDQHVVESTSSSSSKRRKAGQV